ncbi:5' nucleotidase, NT5C type [Shouchella shacheensis]|uniref:5' nucleotidase, NT5C type n=1 Tax=Shouchella shacheensis TaxID=1649580 RepID=UPI0007401F83|nr:hypothetical protein [Shouchella shacheensis]
MKKRLGLDIDGTITDPATFIPYLNQHFNQHLTFNDLLEYDLTTVLKISEMEFSKWMDEHEPTIYSNAEFAKDAEETLREWSKKHDLVFITARRKHHEEVTTAWFNERSLPFTHIELVGGHNKIEAVREQQVDVFFEDKHDNAVAIHEEFNIPVILFDTPYNRMPAPEGVIRVSGWKEAREWVNKWLLATTKP